MHMGTPPRCRGANAACAACFRGSFFTVRTSHPALSGPTGHARPAPNTSVRVTPTEKGRARRIGLSPSRRQWHHRCRQDAGPRAPPWLCPGQQRGQELPHLLLRRRHSFDRSASPSSGSLCSSRADHDQACQAMCRSVVLGLGLRATGRGDLGKSLQTLGFCALSGTGLGTSSSPRP